MVFGGTGILAEIDGRALVLALRSLRALRKTSADQFVQCWFRGEDAEHEWVWLGMRAGGGAVELRLPGSVERPGVQPVPVRSLYRAVRALGNAETFTVQSGDAGRGPLLRIWDGGASDLSLRGRVTIRCVPQEIEPVRVTEDSAVTTPATAFSVALRRCLPFVQKPDDVYHRPTMERVWLETHEEGFWLTASDSFTICSIRGAPTPFTVIDHPLTMGIPAWLCGAVAGPGDVYRLAADTVWSRLRGETIVAEWPTVPIGPACRASAERLLRAVGQDGFSFEAHSADLPRACMLAARASNKEAILLVGVRESSLLSVDQDESYRATFWAKRRTGEGWNVRIDPTYLRRLVPLHTAPGLVVIHVGRKVGIVSAEFPGFSDDILLFRSLTGESDLRRRREFGED